jgi:hypothetical protein
MTGPRCYPARPPLHGQRGALSAEHRGQLSILAVRRAGRARAARLMVGVGALPDRIALAHWYECGPLEAQLRARAEGWRDLPDLDVPCALGSQHAPAQRGDAPPQWVVRLVPPAAHIALARAHLRRCAHEEAGT